jgi:cytoskeletal protein CcmA (bactofilin family)
MLCFELCIGNASNQECHMDEKTNVTPGAFTDRDGEPQDVKGYVPMNIIDDLWPEDDESLISQGKVAMAKLFDAETENNVTPISAADLLSAPAPEPSTRVEPAGFRSISDFEQEFKNYGSEGLASDATTTTAVPAAKSDLSVENAVAFAAEEKQPLPVAAQAPDKPVEEKSAFDLPIVSAPIISAPAVAESVIEEPVKSEPIVDEPVITESLVEETIVVESTETVRQVAVTESFFTYQPDTAEPVVEEAVTSVPAADFAIKTEEEPEIAAPSGSVVAAADAIAASGVAAAGVAAASGVAATVSRAADDAADDAATISRAAVAAADDTVVASRVAVVDDDAIAASRSAVVDFLRDTDDAQVSDASSTDQFAVVGAPAAVAVQEPQVLSDVAQIAMEGSPVPNAIEEEAVAEAREIEERKLALAAAQMGVTQAELQSDTVDEAPEEVEEEPIEQGISVITREATVLGDIITQGHIDIVGRVKGNIDAKGDVAIHGIVRGDVGGSKIGLYDCRVKGNLDAALGVIVDESSIIGGDVKTKNIIFDGKVKGNIDAENVVVLRSHSLTLGDVSAASLAVEPGAILNGTVRTLVDGDLEAPFEEVM